MKLLVCFLTICLVCSVRSFSYEPFGIFFDAPVKEQQRALEDQAAFNTFDTPAENRYTQRLIAQEKAEQNFKNEIESARLQQTLQQREQKRVARANSITQNIQTHSYKLRNREQRTLAIVQQQLRGNSANKECVLYYQSSRPELKKSFALHEEQERQRRMARVKAFAYEQARVVEQAIALEKEFLALCADVQQVRQLGQYSKQSTFDKLRI